MTQTATPSLAQDVYDPNNLLNTLKQHWNLHCDGALSRKLKVTRHVLNNIRTGRLPVCGSMLLWIHEATGIGIDELRRLMGDRRAKCRLPYSLLSK